jgi:hypothetical protein
MFFVDPVTAVRKCEVIEDGYVSFAVWVQRANLSSTVADVIDRFVGVRQDPDAPDGPFAAPGKLLESGNAR